MTAVVDDTDWVGLGRVLCEARDKGGLSHDSAARALCLSSHQIRALECGSGAPFPGKTVRSWCARRYATLLGLDWDRLAQALRRERPKADEANKAKKTDEADRAKVAKTNPPGSVLAKPAPGSVGRRFRIGLPQGVTLLMLVFASAISFGTKTAAPPVPPPIADAFLKAAPPAPVTSAGAAAVEQIAPRDDREVDAKDENVPAAGTASVTDRPKAAAGNVIEVQGSDSRKSPDYIFVSSKRPSVLVKTKRRDRSGGVRMDFAQGAARRVPIAADEIIRVEEGRDLEIFYQGRMLPPQIIASGDWARFVPKSAGGEN